MNLEVWGRPGSSNSISSKSNQLLKKDYTLTKCFEGEPELREKFNLLWDNLSEFDTFISLREPTEDQCERAALNCENWCKMYPVFFPNKNLTPKMANYSLVLPRFIREKKGLVNTMFRLEQEGEHIHQVLNQLERVYKSISKSKHY